MTAGELRKKLGDLGADEEDGLCADLMADHFDLILQALEDSERIDWYEGAHRELYYSHDEGNEWLVVPGFPWQKSVRAAIDAAREKEAGANG